MPLMTWDYGIRRPDNATLICYSSVILVIVKRSMSKKSGQYNEKISTVARKNDLITYRCYVALP